MIQSVTHVCLICILIIKFQGQEANPCSPEQYYDIGLRDCFYCIVLCKNAEARGQLTECKTKCPDFVESSAPSTTTSRTKSNDTATKLSPDISHIWIRIGLIISGAVIFVTVIIVLLIFSWLKRSRDGGKGQHELLEQRNPGQLDPEKLFTGQHELLEQRNPGQLDPENPNIPGCPQQNCQSNSGIQDTQPPSSSELLISSTRV